MWYCDHNSEALSKVTSPQSGVTFGDAGKLVWQDYLIFNRIGCD